MKASPLLRVWGDVFEGGGGGIVLPPPPGSFFADVFGVCGLDRSYDSCGCGVLTLKSIAISSYLRFCSCA